MPDALLLSRVQFGFTLAFHILFPTLTVGLAVFLAALEGRWLRRGDEGALRLYRFFVKLFALGFGMGVVSGIVLSFEFGMNFNRFAEAAGNIIGPLHGYEVLTAFFLEASFLPIVLFGWGRVGPRLHFLATLLVALGTVLSAFWILAANSWMQTPAGYILRDGVFEPHDWWRIIFNPSFPYRFLHMTTASLLTVSFLLAGIAAWWLLKGRETALARRLLSMALAWALVLAPLQIALGDQHGLETLRYQPMKIAAMEAVWRTQRGAPFVVFAWPDQARAKNRFALEIPYGGSLILRHDAHGEVQGLDQVPRADWPVVPVVFFAFRIMLAIGFFLLAVAVLGLWLRWRGHQFDRPWFLRLCVGTAPLGFIAVIAGWFVTEFGRQPWVVQGLLRTDQMYTPLPAASVAVSLALFVVVYHVLLGSFLYFAARLVAQGPEPQLPERVRTASRTAWRLPDTDS